MPRSDRPSAGSWGRDAATRFVAQNSRARRSRAGENTSTIPLRPTARPRRRCPRARSLPPEPAGARRSCRRLRRRARNFGWEQRRRARGVATTRRTPTCQAVAARALTARPGDGRATRRVRRAETQQRCARALEVVQEQADVLAIRAARHAGRQQQRAAVPVRSRDTPPRGAGEPQSPSVGDMNPGRPSSFWRPTGTGSTRTRDVYERLVRDGIYATTLWRSGLLDVRPSDPGPGRSSGFRARWRDPRS
jgi:hypothetical protein